MPARIPEKNVISKKFDKIASKYDITNKIISFGCDIIWRKRLINLLDINEKTKMIDLACGTGDIPIQIVKRHKNIKIIGGDLSSGMLEIAKIKSSKAGFEERISWIKTDIQDMQFEDSSFDIITMVFGLRNLPDMEKGISEISRILKPTGKAFIMEFSLPANKIMRSLHIFYLRYIIPFLGSIITGDKKMYQYLGKTIENFPSPKSVCKMMG
ncbi:MAG: bifunctional demethylmenaquinone methyltransferase/2-methoxy-6-polyprenyl-1,4-benzoquinol methylase UbiE, partial [Caldisericia bacterium]|nr:bifunctional demethylmenaquinone methyltransferase/2-methoxy-6-polyprenyl-1,4-benzoquinol methylase UbiE [Caldisericia bacterium]